MDNKEKKIVRESVMNTISELNLEAFEFKGFTKEGAAFSDGLDTVVVKMVIKNEGFDLEAALEERAEADAKAAEKATKAKEPKVKKAKPTKKDVDEVLDELMG